MRRCPPTYVLPGRNPGLLVRGNIDICNRPKVWNKRAGGYSSVYSASFGLDDGRTVLLPLVLKNPPRLVTETGALRWYRQTGQHLGIFNTLRNAERYSDKLHLQQQRIYGGS